MRGSARSSACSQRPEHHVESWTRYNCFGIFSRDDTCERGTGGRSVGARAWLYVAGMKRSPRPLAQMAFRYIGEWPLEALLTYIPDRQVGKGAVRGVPRPRPVSRT